MESNVPLSDGTHSTPIVSKSPILLYNPQNMDGEQLSKSFSIRKKEYKRIWQDVLTGDMKNPETHYLIQGVRGSGKTTILSRLAYDVAHEDSLKSWLLPILFNEEEYGIYSLFTFWLRVAEELANNQPEHYQTLFQTLSSQTESDAEQAWRWIAHTLDEHQHKIVVFMDNMGEKFDDFDDIEHAQLREVLSLSPQIRLIGASSVIWETHFDATAPFYQFFKLVNLKSIDEDNMHALLRSLAEQTSAEAVQRIEEVISQNPERIEAVRRLTDGVPRTIVLLFQIIMEGAKDSSYAYLEETIDKTTPLYKHRMDDLAPQQRVIINAMAMNWDAMNAKEIAEVTRLPSKTVSAQLAKLHKGWIVDKIQTKTKNHLYIIKERFFNIWYLMRFGKQNDKRRVLWLTRFLESWFDDKELSVNLAETIKDFDKDSVAQIDYMNALLASNNISYVERYFYSLQLSNHKRLSDFQVLEVINKMIDYIDKNENYNDFFIENDNNNDHMRPLVIHLKEIISCTPRIKQELSKVDLSKKQDLIKLLQSKVFISTMSTIEIFLSALIKLLDNFYIESYEDIVSIKDFSFVSSYHFSDYLITFLAKNKAELVYDLFIEKELKEQFKPIYYATVSLLPDERNQEYLRMGSELQGTVDDILQRIEEYREKYA